MLAICSNINKLVTYKKERQVLRLYIKYNPGGNFVSFKIINILILKLRVNEIFLGQIF